MLAFWSKSALNDTTASLGCSAKICIRGGSCSCHQLLRFAQYACSGENIEPQPIEDAVCVSPFIKFCTVVGNDRKHLGALLVPDMDALAERFPGVRPAVQCASPSPAPC